MCFVPFQDASIDLDFCFATFRSTGPDLSAVLPESNMPYRAPLDWFRGRRSDCRAMSKSRLQLSTTSRPEKFSVVADRVAIGNVDLIRFVGDRDRSNVGNLVCRVEEFRNFNAPRHPTSKLSGERVAECPTNSGVPKSEGEDSERTM